MTAVEARRRPGARALQRVAILAAAAAMALCGCEGAGVGVSYSAGYGGGYDQPYGYDYGYDYGPWGPGYYVGPPVIVGGYAGRGYDHDHEHDRGNDDRGGDRGRSAPHYRAAPAPERHAPSIPSRPRPH